MLRQLKLLILAISPFKGEIELRPSDFFPRQPRADLRGTRTDYCSEKAVFAFNIRVVKSWNKLQARIISLVLIL